MKTFESIPHLLNEIFSKFNAAAKIMISCQCCPGLEEEHHVVRVTGVNGFKSITTFTDYLFSLRADLVDGIMDVLPGLDIGAKQQFLHHAIIRCRMLVKTTRIFGSSETGNESDGYRHWVFDHPEFDHYNGAMPDDNTRRELISQTKRYALIFQWVADELLEELKCFYYMVEFLPALSQPPAMKPVREKIPLRVSVQVLGATARLFFESNEIALSNKTQLCRLVADTFSTPKQRDISFASLKNHFDSLSPETLDRICEGFRKIMQNSRNLGNNN
jgi:hypothetical protein